MIWPRANGFQPFPWVPWGVYIGLPPRGTMVIRLDTGPGVSASGLCLLCRPLGPADWQASPTGLVWSRQPASAAGGSCRLLITIAALLMMQAWSWGHGNSAAVWQTITVAIPRLVCLMACGARGRGWSTPGGRLPRVRLRGALAVFCSPADGRSRHLRTVHVGRRGHSAPPTKAEVRAGMATVPRHDGDLQRYGAL